MEQTKVVISGEPRAAHFEVASLRRTREGTAGEATTNLKVEL